MGIFTIINDEDSLGLTLKPVMDLAVAEKLRLILLDCLAQNKTIKIMAGEVERITTPCLQILLAMKNRATEQQIDFSLSEMSDVFINTMKDIGLHHHFISLEHKP